MSAPLAMTASATFEGRPLAELNRLLAERQRILGESARDAVIATGITALQSIRALTRIAPKRIPKADVRFGESDPKYITGTRGRAKGRLLRRTVVSRWRNGQKKNIVKWQLVEGVARTARASARELSEAWRRFGAINRRGLAKTALGIAMNRISTRQTPVMSNRDIAKIAADNVVTRETESGRGFTLEIADALRYAQDALKGGPGAIDLALKKAANRVAGRLSRVAEARLGEKIPTPFPEVKGRKAR